MEDTRDPREGNTRRHLASQLFNYIPTIVWAPVLGFLVMSIGVFAWQIMAGANIQTLPIVPWSTATTAVFLWVYFRYLNGSWWPRSTAEFRRLALRANPIAPAARAAVVAAAIVGLMFTLSLHFLSLRLVELPEGALSFMPRGLDIPWWTLWVSVIMASIVAGVCEEAGIRGYLQTPVERRHGAVLAVLLSATVFTLMHFNRDLGVALAIPFFVSALWYGALTSAANSILPMIFVHIALDVILIGYHDLLGGPVPQPFESTGFSMDFIANGLAMIFTGAGLTALVFRVKRLTSGTTLD